MFSYLVLGIVQGLTEFLPVSSSGHLVLVSELFRFQDLDPAFNVFVQGGTVLSVLFFFRKLIPKLSASYYRYLLYATIPAAVIGILLSDYVDAIFSSLWGVALGFTLTTTLLFLSKRSFANNSQSLTTRTSLQIGLSQALAILPGLSRSGSTITTSLILGITPLEAFNFSFLLSIPTIAGASLLSIRSLAWNPTLTPFYLMGFFTATLTGYLSLVVLNKLVKRGKFYLFAPYTAILAILSLALALN